MTPEEAIEMLKTIRIAHQQEANKAIDMAIDLLLRYDDLISRTELIHKLKHLEQFNNNDVPEWVWGVIGGTHE